MFVAGRVDSPPEPSANDDNGAPRVVQQFLARRSQEHPGERPGRGSRRPRTPRARRRRAELSLDYRGLPRSPPARRGTCPSSPRAPRRAGPARAGTAPGCRERWEWRCGPSSGTDATLRRPAPRCVRGPRGRTQDLGRRRRVRNRRHPPRSRSLPPSAASLTTTTGHLACRATCWLTEPATRPANPPCPREPHNHEARDSARPHQTRRRRAHREIEADLAVEMPGSTSRRSGKNLFPAGVQPFLSLRAARVIDQHGHRTRQVQAATSTGGLGEGPVDGTITVR